MNFTHRKAISTLLTEEFGATPVVLHIRKDIPAISCYRLGSVYIRLDSFPAMDEGRIYCIEAADEADAVNNIFEDAWTYWDGDGLPSILAQMRADLHTMLETAQ